MTDPTAADTPAEPLPTAMFEALLRDLPSRVVVIDAGLRYVYANRAALEFLALPAHAVIGRTVGEVRGAHIELRNRPVIERVLAGEQSQWEGWTDYVGRGRRYTEEWLMPFRMPGETRSFVLGYARDLTDVKRTEHLKTSIVDNALAAIISSDAQGRIVEFNPAAEKMFGVDRPSAIGRSVADVVIPPRHRSGHHAGMERMAHGGKPHVMGRRLEMHAQRASGEEFPIEMVLWQTGAGGEVFYTASIIDTSERVRAAEVIERQRDALRQSEKLTAMGSLLAGVAHELNNPLSIVMGRAGLLEEKAAGTDLAADAHSIREAADRCGRIVRTFLNMARSRPAHRGPVSLNELAAAAADLMQYGLRTHGITMTLQLAPTLPVVVADGDQVGQVVLNLIVNAQQALVQRQAGRQLTLSTGTLDDGGAVHVWLRVADNGPGVPPALAGSIFEPFFTTKPEGLGTGLGLAVSRSIARDHGGDLRLEPSAQGACFCLSLPTDAPAAAPPAPAVVRDPEPASEHAARVLVVDDEAEIADLMREFLETAGFEVATAESGAVALELLDAARFDAVVSDLRMPDMDGATLWREVSARFPSVASRMMFVTGDTLSPGAEAFLQSTGCTRLDKPFSKADLVQQVRRLLGR